MTLTEICNIITSPVIPRTILPYLKGEICQYLKMRKNILPEVPFRPKHHYFYHYPELIERYGPLSRVSTLRMESKHGYNKQSVVSGRTFRNVTKSSSEKHEYLQAALRCGGLFVDEIIIKNPKALCHLDFGSDILGVLQTTFPNTDTNEICVSDEVAFRGITYRAGMFVVGKSGDFGLQLCQIDTVFVKDSYCVAIGRSYDGLLDPTVQLYQIFETPYCTGVALESLVKHPFPVNAYTYQGLNYVATIHL